MAKTASFTGAMYGHTGRASCAVFSPDDRQVLSVGRDGIIVWDVFSGTQVGQTLTVHGNEITSVTFSPDGRSFSSVANDTVLRIWDTETRREIGDPMDHGVLVRSAVFSPDGIQIVSACNDGTVRLWDVQSRRQIWASFPGSSPPGVQAVSFSPDGSRIVSAMGSRAVVIWDAVSGAQIGENLEQITATPTSAAYSPEGRYIISGATDGAIYMWDAQTGKGVGEPMRGHRNVVYSATFSPDGNLIVSSSKDGVVRLWDAHTRKELSQLLHHAVSVTTQVSVVSASFSSKGRFVVSAFLDGAVQIWNVQEELGRKIQHARNDSYHFVNLSATFARDGKHILVSSTTGPTVRIFDTSTGSVSQDYPSILPKLHSADSYTWSTPVSFSSNNAFVISATYRGGVTIYNAVSGEEIYNITRPQDMLMSAVFSPDDAHILTAWTFPYSEADETNRIILFDVASGSQIGEVTVIVDEGTRLKSAAFTFDGKQILTASGDNVVRVWDAKSLLQLDVTLIGCLVLPSTDGRRIATLEGNGTTVHIYDAHKFEHLFQFSVLGKGSFTPISLSPDALYVVVACPDNSIRIYNTSTGNQVDEELTGHSDDIRMVEFSIDGTQILSSGRDKVRLWTFLPDKPASTSSTNVCFLLSLFITHVSNEYSRGYLLDLFITKLVGSMVQITNIFYGFHQPAVKVMLRVHYGILRTYVLWVLHVQS